MGGQSDEPLPAGVVEVESAGGRFRQRVRAGDHVWKADEPAAVGGDDAGPGPYDLLLAALGTCTAMTLQMYAGRKQWPLERVRVRLRHGRVYARDCEDCETKEGRIEVIERTVHIEGPLDSDQRAQRGGSHERHRLAHQGSCVSQL
jgi:uncharacterized OsmC-like protein